MKKVPSIDLRRNQTVYLKARYMSFDESSGCCHIVLEGIAAEFDTGKYEYDGNFYLPTSPQAR
mgnify:FL=1